jgi:D-arabinose 1-dehydrogenase-like Zn-dependent alcohol dehydrogenase
LGKLNLDASQLLNSEQMVFNEQSAVGNTVESEGMSRQAFDRLNAVIGSQAIPLKTEVFPLAKVVEAHERFERGRVLGKLILEIKR